MDVTLMNDVNRKWNPNPIGRRLVTGFHPEEKVEAYEILSSRCYTLALKLKEPSCSNDTWTFRLIRALQDEDCPVKEHSHESASPMLTIYRRREIELTAYELGTDLQVGGHLDHANLQVTFSKARGCGICDAYFLQIGYTGCEGTTHQADVPLLVYNQMD